MSTVVLLALLLPLAVAVTATLLVQHRQRTAALFFAITAATVLAGPVVAWMLYRPGEPLESEQLSRSAGIHFALDASLLLAFVPALIGAGLCLLRPRSPLPVS